MSLSVYAGLCGVALLISPLLVLLLLRLPASLLRPLVHSLLRLLSRFHLLSLPIHAHAPYIRHWRTVTADGLVIHVYNRPALWMTPAALGSLRHVLLHIAHASVQCTPTHALFSASDPLANRVIAVAEDRVGPLAFVAMVYLDLRAHRVLHLGLTMVAARARGRGLQRRLFVRALAVAAMAMARVSFWITNLAASPAGVGAVVEYFDQAWPRWDNPPKHPMYDPIADAVLRHHRHEMGCSHNAWLERETGVVRASNADDGGGTNEFCRSNSAPLVTRSRHPACERWMRALLDTERGDELFQVAKLDVCASLLRVCTRAWRK